MSKLRFVVLRIMIQSNLINHIDLVELSDGRYSVKAYGSSNENFNSLETGEYLMGERSSRLRSYSSIEHAIRALRHCGYKNNLTVITFNKQAA